MESYCAYIPLVYPAMTLRYVRTWGETGLQNFCNPLMEANVWVVKPRTAVWHVLATGGTSRVTLNEQMKRRR